MRANAFKSALAAAIILAFLGVLFKIMHWPFSGFLLLAAFLVSLVVMVLGIIDTLSDKDMSVLKKVLWIVAFLMLPLLTALVYLPVLDRTKGKEGGFDM